MGCGSSTPTEENLKPKLVPETEKKSVKVKFNADLHTLVDLCKELSDFNEQFTEVVFMEHEKFEDHIDGLFENYRKKLEDKKFTPESFKDMVQVISAQEYIEKVLNHQEYNLHDMIREFASYLKQFSSNLDDKDIDTIMNVIKSYEAFPALQKGCVYYVEHLKTQNFAIGHINRNLSLNPDFSLKVLNVGLFADKFENVQFLKGLAEVIDYSQELTTVAIQILENFDDKLIDRKSLKNMNIILEAIKMNKSVKVLMLSLVRGADMIDLGPEVNQKILELVELDRFIGLYIVKIVFNDQFAKKFVSALSDLKNLAFLGLASNENNPPYLFEIFKGFAKNNSLKLICLQNYKVPADKLPQYETAAKACKSLQMYKYFTEVPIS